MNALACFCSFYKNGKDYVNPDGGEKSSIWLNCVCLCVHSVAGRSNESARCQSTSSRRNSKTNGPSHGTAAIAEIRVQSHLTSESVVVSLEFINVFCTEHMQQPAVGANEFTVSMAARYLLIMLNN